MTERIRTDVPALNHVEIGSSCVGNCPVVLADVSLCAVHLYAFLGCEPT